MIDSNIVIQVTQREENSLLLFTTSYGFKSTMKGMTKNLLAGVPRYYLLVLFQLCAQEPWEPRSSSCPRRWSFTRRRTARLASSSGNSCGRWSPTGRNRWARSVRASSPSPHHRGRHYNNLPPPPIALNDDYDKPKLYSNLDTVSETLNSCWPKRHLNDHTNSQIITPWMPGHTHWYRNKTCLAKRHSSNIINTLQNRACPSWMPG